MSLASTASRMTHSMDRCAVFVDAGYLYAEGGKPSGIGPSRRNVRLDALRANECLVGLATTACRRSGHSGWDSGTERRTESVA